MSETGCEKHLALIASGEARRLCPLCQAAEIERLRAAIQAYLDYCAPEEKWQGEPVLLRIRRQMRAALGPGIK